MAEHKAEQQSRGPPKVFTKRIVAVESQQINEEPAGRTSITNKRGRTKRGRKGGGGATPSLAALTDFDARPTLNQWTLKLKTLIGGCPERFARSALRGNVGIA